MSDIETTPKAVALDGHPIDTLPTPPDRGAASPRSMMAIVLSAFGLHAAMAVVVMLIALGSHSLWAAAAVAVGVGGPLLGWVLTGARARLKRALRARAPGVDHAIDTSIGGGAELTLAIEPTAEGAPFDPADPAHLEAAQRLYRCRLRDGIALTPDGAAPALRIRLDALPDQRRTIVDRLSDWLAVRRFLSGCPAPRATWLAAIASAESSDWTRAERALTLLAGDPHQAPLRARVLDWLTDHGPRPAQAAAALVRVDLELVDRLLAEAEPDEPVDTLAALMETRWRLTRDRSALAGWRARPVLVPALARLPLADAGEIHWHQMIGEAPLDVAAVACLTAHGMGPSVALAAARTLLDRSDLAEKLATRDAGPTMAAAQAAIDTLGASESTDDVRRLGIWSRVPGPLGRQAKSHHMRLKLLAGRAETVGALALSSSEGQAGGLSQLD